MSKLTDFVTGEDVTRFLLHYHKKISALKIAHEIFDKHMNNAELFTLRATLVECGFDQAEAGAVLSFLDAAIRHKSGESFE